MNINEFVNFISKEFEVESILCYGSYAQKFNDEKSDIDLLVLLKNNFPDYLIRQACYSKYPNIKILSLDEDFANRWDVSWTPVNDRLVVENQPIDIGFNTIQWVNNVINKLIIENKITFPEFPFRPYTFLGLLESSTALYDENNFIKNCLSKIRPMPLGLRDAIINSFLPILKESYEDIMDYSERNIGILAYEFQLFRGLDALIGILFAINEVYDPASKHTERFLFKLSKKPENLDKFITHVLPRFYENKQETIEFFKGSMDFIKNHI